MQRQRHIVCILLAGLGFASPPALAEDDAIETAEIAIVCLDPYDLHEAHQAGGDMAWRNSLGCYWLREGIKARRLDPPTNKLGGTWKVRVSTDDGGVTVFGWRCAFRLPGASSAFPCD